MGCKKSPVSACLSARIRSDMLRAFSYWSTEGLGGHTCENTRIISLALNELFLEQCLAHKKHSGLS